ncbi:MAG: hypothetical protein AB8G17_13855 [Gammaproteobacteria bacterium]
MLRLHGIKITTVALALIWLLPAGADVLLIPDSGNDRVWAFDPMDGSLLSDNFIPADGNLIQPINAVDSGANSIYVSDENADAVFEYGYDGVLIGTVAAGLDALQGLTVNDGQIYVGTRTGELIYQISPDGTSITTWADAAAVGTPRDVAFRDADALITNSSDENIERFDLTGAFLDTFEDSDGVTGIDFPQQLQVLGNGDVLVAGFSPPRGLYVYDSSGAQIAAFTNLITSPRGVYALGNGQYLYAGGTRVMRYDPLLETEETVINQPGTSFRYIEFSAAPLLVDTDGDGVSDADDNCSDIANADQRDTNLDGFGNVCDADINNDCVINVADLGILRSVFFTADADADFNGDGVVNAGDLGILREAFFAAPGPTGLTNDCEE